MYYTLYIHMFIDKSGIQLPEAQTQTWPKFHAGLTIQTQPKF